MASARAKYDTEAQLGQDRPQMANPEGPVTLDDEAGAPAAVVASQLVERKGRDGHGSEERVGAPGRLLVGVLQNAEPRLGAELGRQWTGLPMGGLVGGPGEVPGAVG